MQDVVIRVVENVGKAHLAIFVLISVACSILVVVPFAIILCVLPDVTVRSVGGPMFVGRSPVVVFMVACIVAPRVETAIFQAFPLFLARGRFGMANPWAVVISACLFGASHFYSAYYIAWAFLVGLLLATAYVVREDAGRPPFRAVLLIHAVRNAFTFVIWYGGR